MHLCALCSYSALSVRPPPFLRTHIATNPLHPFAQPLNFLHCGFIRRPTEICVVRDRFSLITTRAYLDNDDDDYSGGRTVFFVAQS